MGCGGKHDQNKHLMNSCNKVMEILWVVEET